MKKNKIILSDENKTCTLLTDKILELNECILPYRWFSEEMRVLKRNINRDEKNKCVQEIEKELRSCKLQEFPKWQRIYLMDSAIKIGYLSLVKALCKRFIELFLADDIRVPSEDNLELRYRPSFWLSLIVTRQPYATKKDYEAIAKYLCETLNISDRVLIRFYDKLTEKINLEKEVTQQEYCKIIDKWKHAENYRLCFSENPSPFFKGMPRYPRHELLDEIEARQVALALYCSNIAA